MIKVDRKVPKFVRDEAKKMGLAKPVVLIMDCGCMLNQETVEVDIRSEPEEGYEPYTEVDGIGFFVSPKVRSLADSGRLVVTEYAAGKFKKLEFCPAK
jgi:hypothetical protein